MDREEQTRSLRRSIWEMLGAAVEDEETEKRLEALGLPPTRGNQIALCVVTKACLGDITAAKFIRDSTGEEDRGTEGQAVDLTGLSDEALEKLIGE